MGLEKDSGLIHSVATSAANVHDVTVAAELLHVEERVIYGAAGYQVLHNERRWPGQDVECPMAMGPGQRRRLPQTPEGELLHWWEGAQSRIRAKVDHPFYVIKEQCGFQKTRLPGLAKNHCKVMVLAALANLFLAKKRLAMAA